MADDLGDNWWEAEKSDGEADKGDGKGEKSDGEAEEKLEEKAVSNIQSKKRRLETGEHGDTNFVPKTKKKRKRKRITQEKLPTTGGDCDSVRKALARHYPNLSSIEEEDISLKDCNFTTCNNDMNYTILSYFKQVLPKWQRISVDHQHKMSPLLLFICGNALRASKLNTEIRPFIGKKCKSIKLFSRHMKIEEQAKILINSVSHFAVGTPARIKALLQQGSLTLAHTRVVALDWNWRDVKSKTMMDVREVRDSLMLLLKDYVIPACKTSKLKIGLY